MINNKGFTLVELLISIAIIITSATIVVAIITASFRGSSKTLIDEEVRQSGNTTLAQIGKMVQYADSFEGVIPAGGVLQNNCIDTTGEDATFDSIVFKTEDVTHTLTCNNDGLTLDVQSLIDQGRLNIENCELTCSQTSSADSPTIGVSFDLSRFVSDLPEQSASIDSFSKKIKMRNLNQ